MSANDYGILFPTSVVGSMPRPDFVKDLISGETTVTSSEYKQRMEAAVRYVIALQEMPGSILLPMASGGANLTSVSSQNWPTGLSLV